MIKYPIDVSINFKIDIDERDHSSAVISPENLELIINGENEIDLSILTKLEFVWDFESGTSHFKIGRIDLNKSLIEKSKHGICPGLDHDIDASKEFHTILGQYLNVNSEEGKFYEVSKG